MEDAVLYITAQGSRLTRTGERLLVRGKDGKIASDIPLFRLQEVVCFGCVEFSCSALTALVRRGIDVVFLTVDGRFKCRLSNLQPKAVNCRLRQYCRAGEPAFRLRQAQTIVRGKMHNSRVWLLRQNRNRDDAVAAQIMGVKTCIDLVDRASTINELMGIEGTGARNHFDALKRLLKQDLGFSGRVRRPPTDPVNAMLSFAYTLLFNRVLSAVEQGGLDPMLANLHAFEDRRPSLALDLMEEFRVPVVDSIVMAMVNRVEVGPGDFTMLSGKGIRMSEIAIGKLVRAFQARLSEQLPHPVNGKSYSFREMIVQQAWQYKSVVLGEADEYRPIAIR